MNTLFKFMLWCALSLGVTFAQAADFPAASISFDTGKTELPADAATAVGAVAKFLADNADAKIELSGFVDASGDPAKNAELAKLRAFAVRDAIKAAGVDEARIALVKPAHAASRSSSPRQKLQRPLPLKPPRRQRLPPQRPPRHRCQTRATRRG